MSVYIWCPIWGTLHKTQWSLEIHGVQALGSGFQVLRASGFRVPALWGLRTQDPGF